MGTEISIRWALRDRPQSQILGQAQPPTYRKADLEQASVNLSLFNSKMGINPTYFRELPGEAHLTPPSLYKWSVVPPGELGVWGPCP